MAENENNTPPIIKKIKKSSGHHGGAWKVAYADFVTAMMALFIVLWVLGQDLDTKKSVAKYFRDPIAFSRGEHKISLEPSTKISTPDPVKKILDRQAEKEELQKMGDQLIRELSTEPQFKNIMDQIKVKIVKDGLKIELVDSKKDLFFEIGTAKLKMDAILLLKKIGDQLSKLPNKIIIEGHTDARPYSGDGGGYTNFELSADRANSARRALTQSKLKESQIDEVRGYADRRLRDKKDPYNLVNRRISIIVEYLTKK